MACLEVVLNTVNTHVHECFPGEVPKEPLDDILIESSYNSITEDKSPARKSMSKQASFGGLGLSIDPGSALHPLSDPGHWFVLTSVTVP